MAPPKHHPVTANEQNADRRFREAIPNRALIRVTATGLGKSLVDAHAGVRSLLKAEGLHDYETQDFGDGAKQYRPALVETDGAEIPGVISLYRSKTRGDERWWFRNLDRYVEADDLLAIGVEHGVVVIANLTRLGRLPLSAPVPSDDVDDDMAAPEGGAAYRWHRRIERNREIVRRKKDLARKAGALRCAACDFEPIPQLGEEAASSIEAHHVIPLSSIEGIRETRLSDLILLCATCHRLVHALDVTAEVLRGRLDSSS